MTEHGSKRSLTRRRFLSSPALAAGATIGFAGTGLSFARVQAAFAAGTTLVEVNQVGYLFDQAKSFLIQAPSSLGNSIGFSIISTASGASVLQGSATLVNGPTGWPGVYYQGDFSALKTPGTYKVQLASGETSFVFLIADATTVYNTSIQAALSYIASSRSTSQAFQAVIDQWTPSGTTVDLRGGWYDASNIPDVYMGYPEDWNYMVVNCESAVITSLVEYTKIQPNDTTRLVRIKTAVKAYMDFKVATTAGSTDTGNNPYATPLIYYRNSSGTWKTRFFF